MKPNFRQLLKLIGVLILLAVLWDIWIFCCPLDEKRLRDGDLIFQTSLSSQSNAIVLATHSLYSHMGIIRRRSNRLYVIEAAGPVRETPFGQWKKRGLASRISVTRNRKLTPALAAKVLAASRKYYGQPYDRLFRFDNGKMYCSELPYLAYKSVGLSAGQPQRMTELQLGQPAVEILMRSRWRDYPMCRGLKTFEQCKPLILQQELVTPVSVFQDPSFEKVYSNYPPLFSSAITVFMGLIR